jgi:hypothetical protein
MTAPDALPGTQALAVDAPTFDIDLGKAFEQAVADYLHFLPIRYPS